MSELKTVDEMARLLRIAPKTFRKLVDRYNLPFIRAGVQKRFDERKVLRKLEAHGFEDAAPDNKMKKKSAVLIDGWTEKGRKFAEEMGLKV